MLNRQYSLLDQFITQMDQGLRAVSGSMPAATRENPAKGIKETPLSAAEKNHVAGLMRVNHTGEVCAQALYQGQAWVARSKDLQEKLQQSALEENDHLNWCQERVAELGGHLSYLNPLWYSGSLALGVIAGLAGDTWNLGFLAETEHQVVKHLDSHLAQLPTQDHKTQAILRQMREDELHHADTAVSSGAKTLPKPVKTLMRFASKIMTTLAYRI